MSFLWIFGTLDIIGALKGLEVRRLFISDDKQ